MSDTAQEPPVRTSLISLVSRIVFAAVVAGLLIAYGTYFSVSEGQAAVVTRFGEPVREISEAGPYWKLPWPIEHVHLIDARMKLFNTPFTATFTRDKRGVILLTYVAWRVEKPLLFLQAAGGPEIAEKKLDGMVTAAKNFNLGRYDLAALVSTLPGAIKAGEIEQAILGDVRGPMLDNFGIRVEQVGFKRIAFPEENVPAVLANMRAERKSEADRLRAEGDREAQGIRDDALVKSEEMLREGRIKAGAIRGQAEKEAAEIYGAAHKLDPEFYGFWRSLEALKKVLGGKATLILRTDQGFFDVLMGPGRQAKTGAPDSKNPGTASMIPGGPRP
ncbi:MAG TPA: protease modulator HflC [Gemmataceae bacterium]|nr:protease modulator HflC [Gemmataceae bacterium]